MSRLCSVPSSPKASSKMTYTQILGMDIFAFFLAVVSCLGLVVSTASFLRTYTPTNLYLYAADSVAQTRLLYETLQLEDFFSSESHRVNHLASHLDSLEDDIKALMFVVVPTSNIIHKFGAWLRVWKLLYLSYGSDKLRIGLQTVSHQRKRLEREINRAKRHGIEVDIIQLKAGVTATAQLFISSLAESSASIFTKDLELNADLQFLDKWASEDQLPLERFQPIERGTKGLPRLSSYSPESNSVKIVPLLSPKVPPKTFWKGRISGRSTHNQSVLPS